MDTDSEPDSESLPPPLRLSLVLGAAPLLVGTLIYITWGLTLWLWLIPAGISTIFLGLAAFVAGMIAYLIHCFREANSRPVRHRDLWVPEILAIVILLANFPAAWIYGASALSVMTRYTVCVENSSQFTVENFLVTGPGVEIEFGPTLPGQSARRHFRFQGDGALKFEASQQEVQFEGLLEEYVTHSMGGYKKIRISEKGVYDIQANAIF